MKRAFATSGVIAFAGFLFVQFVFEGASAILTAMVGAAVGLSAAAPVFGWLLDHARDASILHWIALSPERVGELFGEAVARDIHLGDVMNAEYPKTVQAVEQMALATRDLAAVGRDRLREADLRKAL